MRLSISRKLAVVGALTLTTMAGGVALSTTTASARHTAERNWEWCAQNAKLSWGASGQCVALLQWGLNQPRCGGAGLKLDGEFGRLTHTAVFNFQSRRALGFKPHGIAGKITWAAVTRCAR